MDCPKCKGKTKVIDCVALNSSVIRKRKCTVCNNSFHTEENIGNNLALAQLLNGVKYCKYGKEGQ